MRRGREFCPRSVRADARLLASDGYAWAGHLAGVGPRAIKRAIERPEKTTRSVMLAIRRAAELVRAQQRKLEGHAAERQAREMAEWRAREAQREVQAAAVSSGGRVVSLADARSAQADLRRTTRTIRGNADPHPLMKAATRRDSRLEDFSNQAGSKVLSSTPACGSKGRNLRVVSSGESY